MRAITVMVMTDNEAAMRAKAQVEHENPNAECVVIGRRLIIRYYREDA